MAKTLLAMTATLSAMTSFWKKPQSRRSRPLWTLSASKTRVKRTCPSIFPARMMGPATSCGNNETKTM